MPQKLLMRETAKVKQKLTPASTISCEPSVLGVEEFNSGCKEMVSLRSGTLFPKPVFFLLSGEALVLGERGLDSGFKEMFSFRSGTICLEVEPVPFLLLTYTRRKSLVSRDESILKYFSNNDLDKGIMLTHGKQMDHTTE